ncbi:MAG: hypothetical protein QW292_12080 [Candidatus Parvarchaeota archaeon]
MLEMKDDWSTREVRVLIEEKFGVEYSMKPHEGNVEADGNEV